MIADVRSNTVLVTFALLLCSELYYPSDVRDVVTYGHLRGVQVLPEFDAPAHASMGWQFGKEKGINKNGKLCPQLLLADQTK